MRNRHLRTMCAQANRNVGSKKRFGIYDFSNPSQRLVLISIMVLFFLVTADDI